MKLDRQVEPFPTDFRQEPSQPLEVRLTLRQPRVARKLAEAVEIPAEPPDQAPRPGQSYQHHLRPRPGRAHGPQGRHRAEHVAQLEGPEDEHATGRGVIHRNSPGQNLN